MRWGLDAGNQQGIPVRTSVTLAARCWSVAVTCQVLECSAYLSGQGNSLNVGYKLSHCWLKPYKVFYFIFKTCRIRQFFTDNISWNTRWLSWTWDKSYCWYMRYNNSNFLLIVFQVLSCKIILPDLLTEAAFSSAGLFSKTIHILMTFLR